MQAWNVLLICPSQPLPAREVISSMPSKSLEPTPFVSTPPGKGGHFKSLDFSPLAERVWDPISVNLL